MFAFESWWKTPAVATVSHQSETMPVSENSPSCTHSWYYNLCNKHLIVCPNNVAHCIVGLMAKCQGHFYFVVVLLWNFWGQYIGDTWLQWNPTLQTKPGCAFTGLTFDKNWMRDETNIIRGRFMSDRAFNQDWQMSSHRPIKSFAAAVFYPVWFTL